MTTSPYQWKQYARCDECGVDDGERCRTDDDEKAEHPCADRKRRRGAVRADGICNAGHRVEGTNVKMMHGYTYCRECHNANQRETDARRRNRSLPTEQMKPVNDQRTIDEVLARAIKAERERNALRIECGALLEAVVHAEHIFDSYVRHHRATGAIEKMERNEKHAEKMRVALRLAFASAFPDQKAAE